MTSAASYFDTVTEVQGDIVVVGQLSEGLGYTLTGLENFLKVPGELEKQLTGMSDALDFPDPIVAVLGVLPYGIGTAIKTIDRIATATSDTIETQANAMKALDAAWATPRTLVTGVKYANTALSKAVSAAQFANDQLHHEAQMLKASIGSEDIGNGFVLATKIEGYEDVAGQWFDVRDTLLSPLRAAQTALDEALDQLGGLIPDTALLDEASAVIQTVFQPLVDAAEAIEDALCVDFVLTPEIVIPGTPPVYDPIWGVLIWPGTPDVVIPAVTVDICAIIQDLSNQVQAVQDFVEDVIFGVLAAVGVDLLGAIDDLEALLLAPLQPVFDALEAFQDAAAGLAADLADQLDPLNDQINELLYAFEDATRIVSLFENTVEGDRGDTPDDVLTGTDAEDAIFGLEGNDMLTGAGGGDFLFGGKGDDTLVATDGDEAYGGGGKDLLTGSGVADRLDGGKGKDTVDGGAGDDLLAGGKGKDTLTGGSGDDKLRGGAKKDNLDGGSGEDWLKGGAGNDILTGGADADMFVFTGGEDKIMDFADDEDTIALSLALVGEDATVDSVLDMAKVNNKGHTVFDFGDGDLLKVKHLSDIDLLADDLVFV